MTQGRVLLFHYFHTMKLITTFAFCVFLLLNIAQAQLIEMPYNRQILSAGNTLTYGNGNLENHSMDAAVIPGENKIVVEDRYGIAVVDMQTEAIIYRWEYEMDSLYQNYMGTFSGINCLAYKGTTYIAWGASKRGGSKVMIATWNGQKISLSPAITLLAKPPASNALANEVIFSVEQDIPYLYTTLNGNNEVRKYELLTTKLVWTSTTGNAPFGACLANEKLFVSNWAGPLVTDTTLPHAGIPWGDAYTNPTTGATEKGSVSVYALADGKLLKEIPVGLHPTAIKPNIKGSDVYVTNGNSDNISQINTSTLQVQNTTPVGLYSTGSVSVGSTPNALCFHPNGQIAYVANGLDNAVAVLQLPTAGQTGIKVLGYIPTEAYPSGMALVNNKLLITNLEARGAGVLSSPGQLKYAGVVPANAYSIHKQLASISIVGLPGKKQLKKFTVRVQVQNMQVRMNATLQPARANQPALPVPQRIGEPSVFKYVVYIIKENKTYDQVFGDIAQGNGDSSYCIFGQNVTPNQHAIAARYGLMDQYYASGKSSAEGHQWTDGAMVSDYVEKNVRAWFRSYPHRQEDALVYNKSGFIWNHAVTHGKTVRVFGEACTTVYDRKLKWSDMYNLYTTNNLPPLYNITTIAPLRPLISPNFPDCDNMTFSDQMRADVFIKEWKAYETNNNLPHLMVLSLPNDHTAGTSPNWPTPSAMVADNDLAVGRIIQAITNSKYWDSTVVFITQDDSQSGWDHVSPYRTVGMVVSPYNKPGLINTTYNQTCMVRTIEQILGIPPMNVIDATAKTMGDCFTNQKVAGGNRFTQLINNIPLNQMNPGTASLTGKAKEMAILSAKEAFKEEVDNGNDDAMNRILWFYAKGLQPYPGDSGTK